jgi:hypothetical protein
MIPNKYMIPQGRMIIRGRISLRMTGVPQHGIFGYKIPSMGLSGFCRSYRYGLGWVDWPGMRAALIGVYTGFLHWLTKETWPSETLEKRLHTLRKPSDLSVCA